MYVLHCIVANGSHIVFSINLEGVVNVAAHDGHDSSATSGVCSLALTFLVLLCLRNCVRYVCRRYRGGDVNRASEKIKVFVQSINGL